MTERKCPRCGKDFPRDDVPIETFESNSYYIYILIEDNDYTHHLLGHVLEDKAK